jgi:integrase
VGKPRKRTSGTGTVIARANGTFTAQVTDVDGRRSIGTFGSRAAAEKALASAMVEGPPPALDATFGEYLVEWLDDQTLTLKATTVARNRSLIRCYVLAHRIARRKVRDLGPADFRALYRELAARGGKDGAPLAPGTIATLDQVLKSAVGRLVDDRVLRWHPIPRRAVKATSGERPWLDIEQVRELIRFARFRSPDLEVVVRLGALAGLRRGEICGLRWSDIDLDAGTSTIRRNRTVANGRVGETSPKTAGSRSTVALDEGTVAALQRHRARRAALIEDDVPAAEYVVCTAAGKGLDPTNLARSFRRLFDAFRVAHPGELPNGIGLHSLRHSFASNLVASGTNLKIAAEAMRHTSVRMMDIYAHLAPSTVGEAVRTLAAEVGA